MGEVLKGQTSISLHFTRSSSHTTRRTERGRQSILETPNAAASTPKAIFKG